MSGHHALPERSRPTSSLEEPRSDPAERSATARTRAPLEVAGSAGGGSGTLLSSPAPLTWARVRHLFRNARRRVNLARARCLGVGAFALLLVGSAATLVPYARVRTCGRQPTPSPAQPPGHPMGHPQSPGQPPAHPRPLCMCALSARRRTAAMRRARLVVLPAARPRHQRDGGAAQQAVRRADP